MGKKNFNNQYSKLESSEQTKKYIKEMYDMADKTEIKSNIAFAVIAVPIAIICVLTLVQMFSFTINFAKGDSTSKQAQIISSDTSENTSTEAQTEASTVSETLNEKIYNYLKDENNRNSSLQKSIKLNKGSDKGLSTIFVAQILRDNGYNISNSIINTNRLVAELEKNGWEKVSDYTKLQPGDICFTSNSKSGAPSHTYIFMDWVKEGKTDYAYVVDNQVSEYKDTYHKRNIDSSTPKKDKFNFFMRKK
ncbi:MULTISPECIES: peptidoglycan amidohydrolase family protein [Clostridium]|uniref:Bacteriophage peptidoglycan hydrolase n=2 Tax=Clostridium TaxID=1485 RepID=A0A151AKE5_9CLOT|nr:MULTISPECIES: peptidoglycan amidohydrolase family protein [Clostridium]KYH28139.1 bacteriophage peptidoglycan hydrolase [Clostridium colicanis DSM 13634]MBE6043085.1 hypothetical protein [Clostridium thermopalmarium]PRR72683.1 Bacteriophage peptidoglycan hydrolase [Clostridium thermopalmarium DSM 5974]PVZ20903.1 peptidoglycan hydrolase [Clostridium thermopalmarium DSM 5974]